MSNSENEKKIYSSLTNSYNSIVSFISLTINNKNCLLGLDTKGILYIWIIKKEYFSIISDTTYDLLDFSDHKVYFPEIAFDISSAIHTSSLHNNFDKSLHFTKLQKFNEEFLIFTGNFNTAFIKIDQIESIIKNSTKFSQNALNNEKARKFSCTEIKNIDIDITLNDYTKCNSQNSPNLRINGVEIDHINQKIFTFSSNGDLFQFVIHSNTLNTLDLERSLNINYYDNSDMMSITSCKLIVDQNKLVCGTNKSSLVFRDSRNLRNLGIFDLGENKFYEDESAKASSDDENFEEDFLNGSVNCIAVSSNCIFAGCDSYIVKYNQIVNSITKIYPTNKEINDLLYNSIDDDIYVAATGLNKVLRFKSTGKVYSKYTTSSNSVCAIEFVQFFDKKVLVCAGDSSYIDVIDNSVLFKLMF